MAAVDDPKTLGRTRLSFADEAEIDEFALVPELRKDPLRLEVASAGIVKERWMK